MCHPSPESAGSSWRFSEAFSAFATWPPSSRCESAPQAILALVDGADSGKQYSALPVYSASGHNQSQTPVVDGLVNDETTFRVRLFAFVRNRWRNGSVVAVVGL